MAATPAWVAAVAGGVRSGIASLQSSFTTPAPRAIPVAFGQLAAWIDLSTTPSPYRQPDRTTCGSATLVMARMINNSDFSRTVIDPAGGAAGGDVGVRFQAEVLAMHESTNSLRDNSGQFQLPWPKSLGTQPWALARRMSAPAGCGVPGSTYIVRVSDPARLGDQLAAVSAAVGAGHCTPIFVGDALSPRHIALVLDVTADGFGIYDPSRGQRVEISRAEIESAAMNLAGWHTYWLSVLPRG